MTASPTPARYSYRRTITGGYNVRRGDEYLGGVKRDGRAWIITTTARGPITSARYATRTDAVDALSIMLRRAAELDAMPTDDLPADEPVRRGPSPAVVREAVRRFQAELTATAPAIGRLLDEPLPGE